MSKLSRFLRNHRKRLGMTIDEAAAKTAISVSTFSSHERGKRIPGVKSLLEYSCLYHVSIHELVDLEIEDIKEAQQ